MRDKTIVSPRWTGNGDDGGDALKAWMAETDREQTPFLSRRKAGERCPEGFQRIGGQVPAFTGQGNVVLNLDDVYFGPSYRSSFGVCY